MTWIIAVRYSAGMALWVVALLMSVDGSLASSLTCPVVPSTGQPACDVSLDAGSSVPDALRSEHVGNPVDVVSGNKYQTEVDVSLGGSQLSLVRHYNSARSAENLGLGNGWRHTYSVSLSAAGDRVRRVLQSDGRLIEFHWEAGLFKAAHESDGYLDVLGDNRHVWNLPDGRQLFFQGSFLTRILFAKGSYLRLFYRSGRLQSVTDESGRSLQFYYAAGKIGLPSYEGAGGAAPSGHLSAVELPDGSLLEYAYSARQNLLSVTYPSGAPSHQGRGYRYQDPMNSALLTERIDGLGRVLGRWSYDELGRAISFSRGSNIRADGTERGPPTLTLSFSAGKTQHEGKTTVLSRQQNAREYEWTLDSNGEVASLTRLDVGDSMALERATDRLKSPANVSGHVQHYPHDELTVMALGAFGYPDEIQYALARDGTLHLLNADYDQAGRLVDVQWQSGTVQSVNDSQPVTRREVLAMVQRSKATGENKLLALSALARMGQIAGMATEFLKETSKELQVGSTVTGEELDEHWRTGSFNSFLDDTPRRYKSDDESEEICIDPLSDCDTLLRTRDYAEVAECAYVDAACSTRFVEADLGVLNLEISDLHEGSFHAEIFYDRSNDEYIVSFAGTDFTSTSDWINNVAQEFGMSSFQYAKAVELARQLVENTPGKNFRFVGHSLGGGLATVAAAAVGGEATVFNPAALDSESATRLGVDFESAMVGTQIYSVSGELLSNMQTEIGFSNEPPGVFNQIPRPNYAWIQEHMHQNPYMLYETRLGVVLHGMSAVRQSLEDMIRRNQCV